MSRRVLVIKLLQRLAVIDIILNSLHQKIEFQNNMLVLVIFLEKNTIVC
jgi:hypothetical protein